MTKPSVALTIIMKDEESVIKSTIEAARPYVDKIVVVDTGSSDRSIIVAQETIGSSIGTVVNRPWKGFADSRNDALEIAFELADYSLMIDADSLLVAETNANSESLRQQLRKPIHKVHIVHGNTRYSRPLIVHRDSGARYKGVVHEFLEFPKSYGTPDLITGFHVVNNGAGISARNKNPQKYFDDAVTLRDALESDPQTLTSRYTFYLAQSYMHAGLLRLALRTYEQRVMQGDWLEEVYISYLAIAKLKEKLKFPNHEIIHALLMAHESNPRRAESLCELARFARAKSLWNLAHMTALRGLQISEPEDSLFSDMTVYRWRLRFELSISSWYVGRFDEGAKYCSELISSGLLDEAHQKTTVNNLRLYNERTGNRIDTH